ncbi:unnamed protein product, partial [Owenia fusiformis]
EPLNKTAVIIYIRSAHELIHNTRFPSFKQYISKSQNIQNTMDLQERGEHIYNTLERLRADENGWKVCKKGKDVIVYWRPSEESGGTMYRSVGNIDAPPEKVWKYLDPRPGTWRPLWDKAVPAINPVQIISEELLVVNSQTSSAMMGMISPRDFVDLVLIKVREHDGAYTTNSHSHQNPDVCPPHPNFVRGTNSYCGVVCQPIPGEPNKTRIINIMDTNIGGMLPKSLVDSALPSNQIGMFQDLRNAIRKNIRPKE